MTAMDVLFDVFAKGGAYSIAVFGWLAWWYERRTNRENMEKLIELASAQIQAALKHEAALSANTRLMERMMDR